MKSFFIFNKQKTILFVLLLLFAPIPFFLPIAGRLPPFYYIFQIIITITNGLGLASLIYLIILIPQIILTYLLTNILYLPVHLGTKPFSWLYVSMIIMILFIGSFFQIYNMGTSEWSGKFNFKDLCEVTRDDFQGKNALYDKAQENRGNTINSDNNKY